MVPPGKDVVVIASAGAIVNVNAFVGAAPALSTTRTVKLLVPAVVGVPDMTPVLVLILNPSGRDPADMDHVSGAVPPAAVMVFEYAAFAVPLGMELVVIVSSTATVMDN